MKSQHKNLWISFVLLTSLIFVPFKTNAGKYVALDDLREIKIVFDVRSKKVKTAALQLDLIHKTFHDHNIRNVSAMPEFTLVFSGAAVRMITTDRDDFSDQEKMLLDLIAGKLSEMMKDGIRLEICLFAADIFDVEPETILPGIVHVENGWISLAGYQAKGYSMVPVY